MDTRHRLLLPSVLLLSLPLLFSCETQPELILPQATDGETLRVSAEAPSAAPVLAASAAQSMRYFVVWGGPWEEVGGAIVGDRAAEIHPIELPMTVQEFYGYPSPYDPNGYGASMNPPAEVGGPSFLQEQVAQFLLFRNGNSGEVSFVGVFDVPRDADGGVAKLRLSGIPDQSFFTVQDDPSEPYSINNTAHTNESIFRWRDCCTDGFAIASSPSGFSSPFQMTVGLEGVTGLNTVWVRSWEGDYAIKIPLPWSATSGFTFIALPNDPPTAVASVPETVELVGAPTVEVVLDGTGSTDPQGPEGLTYSWALNGVEVSQAALATVSLRLGTHTVRLTVSDGAENDFQEVKVTVVDPTPPVLTPHINGPPGNDGWYTGPLTVSWTIENPEGPVDGRCAIRYFPHDWIGEVSCTVTFAGVPITSTVEVKLDQTPPEITFFGNAGTYRLSDDLAITCEATDALSGVASVACPEGQRPALELGSGTHLIPGQACDVAGNCAEASTEVTVLPNTPPTAVASGPGLIELIGERTAEVSLDGSASTDAETPGALTYSWTLNGVEVSTDALATVSVGLGSQTFTLTVSDGVLLSAQDVTVTVKDPSPPTLAAQVDGPAGMGDWYTGPVTVSWAVEDLESDLTTACDPTNLVGDGIHQLSCTAMSAGGSTTAQATVKIDGTPPELSLVGNQGSYTLSQEINITCEATDNLSGVASVECEGASGAALDFGPGIHFVEATATDAAGNRREVRGEFEVVVIINDLRYFVTEFVHHRGTLNSLLAKLDAAERSLDRGNSRAFEGQVKAFIHEVEAAGGKNRLTEDQADFLIRMATALMG